VRVYRGVTLWSASGQGALVRKSIVGAVNVIVMLKMRQGRGKAWRRLFGDYVLNVELSGSFGIVQNHHSPSVLAFKLLISSCHSIMTKLQLEHLFDISCLQPHNSPRSSTSIKVKFDMSLVF
jgi:hypothetical protein